MEKFWSLVKNKNDIFIFNSLTKKKMLLKSNDIYFDKYKDYKMYKINSNNFKYLLEKGKSTFHLGLGKVRRKLTLSDFFFFTPTK